MKKRRILKNITDYIVDNRMKFFFALISLVTGVVIGSLSAIFLEGDDFDALGTYMNGFVSAHTLQSMDEGSVFCFSVYNNIKTALLLWCSGFWIGLIPIGMLQLCAKGYKIGFTTVFLVQLYRGKGILFFLVSVIPQFILLIPALLVYAVFNMNFALTVRKIRQRGQAVSGRKDLLMKNLIFLVAVIVVLILCSLIDTFVVPPVLKPICSYVIE